MKYISWFNNGIESIQLGKFDSLQDAQKCIYDHSEFKKSLYTKKGDATARNKNNKYYYRIYDTQGYGWSIK